MSYPDGICASCPLNHPDACPGPDSDACEAQGHTHRCTLSDEQSCPPRVICPENYPEHPDTAGEVCPTLADTELMPDERVSMWKTLRGAMWNRDLDILASALYGDHVLLATRDALRTLAAPQPISEPQTDWAALDAAARKGMTIHLEPSSYLALRTRQPISEDVEAALRWFWDAVQDAAITFTTPEMANEVMSVASRHLDTLRAALSHPPADEALTVELLREFVDWSKSYPTTVFHEADKDELKRAHEALKAGGCGGIDWLSAMVYRHALRHIGERAQAALDRILNTEGEK
jgi:hypothetical protein